MKELENILLYYTLFFDKVKTHLTNCNNKLCKDYAHSWDNFNCKEFYNNPEYKNIRKIRSPIKEIKNEK